MIDPLQLQFFFKKKVKHITEQDNVGNHVDGGEPQTGGKAGRQAGKLQKRPNQTKPNQTNKQTNKQKKKKNLKALLSLHSFPPFFPSSHHLPVGYVESNVPFKFFFYVCMYVSLLQPSVRSDPLFFFPPPILTFTCRDIYTVIQHITFTIDEAGGERGEGGVKHQFSAPKTKKPRN